MLATVFAVAVAARWSTLPQSMVLGDSLGPWLVAYRGPWSTAPHAPPYGWLLAVPHAVILGWASSVYDAVAGIRVVDALVAPLGAWAALRLTRRVGSALAVGLLLGLDPGLLDTATSGAEAYQAPVAVALLVLATTIQGRAGPWLTAGSFAWAVMCHPLAACVAPLLLRVRWRLLPLSLLLALVGPHVLDLASHASDAIGPEPAFPTSAVAAWVSQGGGAVAVFAVATGAGVRGRATRRVMTPALVSVALLLGSGTGLGYLRDHHLRIVSAPVAVGLAALPSPVALFVTAVLLRVPSTPQRAGALRRPGTLGLLHSTTTAVAPVLGTHRPVVVDGLRTVHTPAVEPGAVWLDLLLRGTPTAQLDASPESEVVVLVTARRHAPLLQTPEPHGLRRLAREDTQAIWIGTPEAVHAWSTGLCADLVDAGEPVPRVGGAWDGLALVHPERGAGRVSEWWACSDP